jgi:hypothetical protein
MHVVRWVFSRHGGGEPPSAAMAARAEELEHVRQFFWFYSRSAAATANNISSAVGRIRKFEAEMGLPCVPSVMYPECHSEMAAGWFLAERASKAKMQSMGADASAFHQLFGAAAVANPFNASTAGMRSSLGRTRLGAEHVLGVQKIATARFPMAVVLAVQDLCLQRAQGATTADDKLFWLYTAFYVVVNTIHGLPSAVGATHYSGVPCMAFGPTAILAEGLAVSTLPVSTSGSLSARWL